MRGLVGSVMVVYILTTRSLELILLMIHSWIASPGITIASERYKTRTQILFSSPVDRQVSQAVSLANLLKSSATMQFKFQSILALAALVPLTIGSPLLRRALAPAVVSDLSAIDTAANAATDAANALPILLQLLTKLR
jgi:hypothetical protein